MDGRSAPASAFRVGKQPVLRADGDWDGRVLDRGVVDRENAGIGIVLDAFSALGACSKTLPAPLRMATALHCQQRGVQLGQRRQGARQMQSLSLGRRHACGVLFDGVLLCDAAQRLSATGLPLAVCRSKNLRQI